MNSNIIAFLKNNQQEIACFAPSAVYHVFLALILRIINSN